MLTRMTTKVVITTRAVIQRINRKLAAKSQTLYHARDVRGRVSVDAGMQMLGNERSGMSAIQPGSYYIVDRKQHSVARFDVKLKKLATELGVLRSWERLAGG